LRNTHQDGIAIKFLPETTNGLHPVAFSIVAGTCTSFGRAGSVTAATFVTHICYFGIHADRLGRVALSKGTRDRTTGKDTGRILTQTTRTTARGLGGATRQLLEELVGKVRSVKVGTIAAARSLVGTSGTGASESFKVVATRTRTAITTTRTFVFRSPATDTGLVMRRGKGTGQQSEKDGQLEHDGRGMKQAKAVEKR
jgi:hypothetical protein